MVLQREVKTFDAASLNGSPQNFGTATAIATYKFSVINASDSEVTIDDGTGQDDYVIPAGATINIGEGLYQEGRSVGIDGIISTGTQLVIDGAAGTGTIVAYLFGE